MMYTLNLFETSLYTHTLLFLITSTADICYLREQKNQPSRVTSETFVQPLSIYCSHTYSSIYLRRDGDEERSYPIPDCSPGDAFQARIG